METSSPVQSDYTSDPSDLKEQLEGSRVKWAKMRLKSSPVPAPPSLRTTQFHSQISFGQQQQQQQQHQQQQQQQQQEQVQEQEEHHQEHEILSQRQAFLQPAPCVCA